MNHPEAIARKFALRGTLREIIPWGNGHINDTYRIILEEPDKPGYILQRKNHLVFKNIPEMMENIARVTNHIRTKLEAQNVPDINRKVVTLIETKKGTTYYRDDAGNYWACFLFIRGCKNYEQIEKPEQAYLAGKAFGQFQKQLSDLPGKPLNETIPDFHNLEFRLGNFQKALEVNYRNRKQVVQDEIGFAHTRAEEMKTLLNLLRAGKLPRRITHNDTKINNILFDRQDHILCIIDLDTVMPGLVHYDFGDAIRTAANTGKEDEPDLTKISVNMPIFEAFTRGFLEELKEILTPEEKKWLSLSARFMAYIMGLRFLTDYLEGDVYYKIHDPDHNRVRARSQFRLVEEMEKRKEEMQEIVIRWSHSQ